MKSMRVPGCSECLRLAAEYAGVTWRASNWTRNTNWLFAEEMMWQEYKSISAGWRWHKSSAARPRKSSANTKDRRTQPGADALRLSRER
jgi:hypothetical protein